MNNPEQTAIWPDGITVGQWDYDGAGPAREDPAAAAIGGLVSLGYIRAALKRRRRFWLSLLVLGFLIGCGLYVKLPPAPQATTTVLVMEGPNMDPTFQVNNDVALAASTAVAAGAKQQLGLQESIASFLASYSVTPVSSQVLTFTVSAPTTNDAVARASAIATQFLNYRARYSEDQEQETEAQLAAEVTAAQQKLDSVNQQISQLSAQGGSSDQLAKLKTQRTAASNNLAQVQQYVTGAVAQLQTGTRNMVAGSQVINAAEPLKQSHTKSVVLYVGGGLVGGLGLGVGIVAIGAVISDRLRRRDDIASAFGAPVKLSVGPLRAGRLGRTPARDRDMRLVVEHLRGAVPGSSLALAGLAVVPVDDPDSAARAVVALAVSSAEQGIRVILADLSRGGLAARILGVAEPGMHRVASEGAQLIVTIPDPDDVAPVGPLRSKVSAAGYTSVSGPLANASAAADLLLTLITLDPAFGGDHLATWATDAVAVVTAGRSKGTTIHSVAEMIRLAGMRLNSVILIDADKEDQSLGVPNTASQPVPEVGHA